MFRARETFRRSVEEARSRWRPMLIPAKGFVAAATVLSLLFSIHADIFHEEANPILELFRRPLTRIGEGYAIDQVSLSNLLTSKAPGAEQEADQRAEQSPSLPLYVFGLDISGSMVQSTISEAEKILYTEKLRPQNGRTDALYCWRTDGQKEIKAFDVAVSELCRYFYLVQRPCEAALWSFGETPSLVLPERANDKGPKYQEVLLNPPGGEDGMGSFFEHALDLKANERKSDFRSLLTTWAETYKEELESFREIHFIIVSDFYHDIGGRDVLEDALARSDAGGLPARTRWRSLYRESDYRISSTLDFLSRAGSTFHLAIIRGAQVSFRDILPSFGDHVDWDGYREFRLNDPDAVDSFDFLRAYEESAIGLEFKFSPGVGRPRKIKINFDSERFRGGYLQVGLASDGRVENLPFRLAVDYPESQQHDLRWISTGSSYNVYIERAGASGEGIILQPEGVLSSREAGQLRLLISWVNRDRGRVDPRATKTYTVRISFKKRFTMIGAWAVFLSAGATTVFLLWLLILFLAGALRETSRLSHGAEYQNRVEQR